MANEQSFHIHKKTVTFKVMDIFPIFYVSRLCIVLKDKVTKIILYKRLTFYNKNILYRLQCLCYMNVFKIISIVLV